MAFFFYSKKKNISIKFIIVIYFFVAIILILKKLSNNELIENQLKNYIKKEKKKLDTINYENELSSTKKYVQLLRQNFIKVDYNY